MVDCAFLVMYVAPRSGPGEGISRPRLKPKKVIRDRRFLVYVRRCAITYHIRRFPVATPLTLTKKNRSGSFRVASQPNFNRGLQATKYPADM